MHRGIDDDSLTIGVDPKFLDTTFMEFNITKDLHLCRMWPAFWTRPWVTRIDCKLYVSLLIFVYSLMDSDEERLFKK